METARPPTSSTRRWWQFGYFDLPDDVILRVILTRRKNRNFSITP
jgi:hypothetical protein